MVLARRFYDPKLSLEVQEASPVLDAIAELATNGIIVKTGATTAATRTITGTANKIAVTNGDGVAGDPTITIPDSPVLVTPSISGGTQSSPSITTPTISSPTITGSPVVPDEAYGPTWNASLGIPTKNAVYDKIESLPVAGFTLLASGSFPAANLLAITGITAKKLLIKVLGASCATATRYLKLQLSNDNGSTYPVTLSGYYVSGGTIAAWPDSSSALPTNTTEVAAGQVYVGAELNTQTGLAHGYFNSNSAASRVFMATMDLVTYNTAINAVQFIWNGSGNFDAGTYEIYGL